MCFFAPKCKRRASVRIRTNGHDASAVGSDKTFGQTNAQSVKARRGCWEGDAREGGWTENFVSR